jgi:hypothetical protein
LGDGGGDAGVEVAQRDMGITDRAVLLLYRVIEAEDSPRGEIGDGEGFGVLPGGGCCGLLVRWWPLGWLILVARFLGDILPPVIGTVAITVDIIEFVREFARGPGGFAPLVVVGR